MKGMPGTREERVLYTSSARKPCSRGRYHASINKLGLLCSYVRLLDHDYIGPVGYALPGTIPGPWGPPPLAGLPIRFPGSWKSGLLFRSISWRC
jgi:hypothetical protein